MLCKSVNLPTTCTRASGTILLQLVLLVASCSNSQSQNIVELLTQLNTLFCQLIGQNVCNPRRLSHFTWARNIPTKALSVAWLTTFITNYIFGLPQNCWSWSFMSPVFILERLLSISALCTTIL